MANTLIQIADVMSVETAASTGTSSAANGSTVITIGSAESGEIFSTNTELWHPAGIVSIPALPNAVNNNVDCSQVMYLERSDDCIAFATRDTRTELLGGNINPGETVIYNSTTARVALKSDDSITMMCMSSDGTNKVSFGINPTSLFFMAPWGRMVFDATGFHLATISGAQLDMGALNFPGLSSLASFVNLNAGQISMSAPIVNLGLGLTGFFPLVIPLMVPGMPLVPILCAAPAAPTVPPLTVSSSIYVSA